MQSVPHLKLVPSGLVSVKTIASRYGISKSTLYEMIKIESDFPYVNVGLKKKIMIKAPEFDSWLHSRTEKQKSMLLKLPTAEHILEKYRK